MSPNYTETMNTYGTTKLNASNWDSWRPYVKSRLMMKGLRECLENQPPTTMTPERAEKEQRALGILVSTLDESQYPHVEDCDSAYMAFRTLRDIHQPISEVALASHQSAYGRITWEPRNETLTEFVTRFQELRRKIIQCGGREPDGVTVAKLMGLMPWTLRGTMHRYNALSATQKGIHIAVAMLEEEYKQAVAQGALAAPGKGRGGDDKALFTDGSHRSNKKKKGTCHNCGKKGHWAIECRGPKIRRGGKERQRYEDQQGAHLAKDNAREFLLTCYDEPMRPSGIDLAVASAAESDQPPMCVDGPGATSMNGQMDPTMANAVDALPSIEASVASMDAATETANAAIPNDGFDWTDAALSALSHDDLVLDSGATTHMTGNETNLQDVQPCLRRVTVANGKTAMATATGKMTLMSPNNHELELEGVLYVPNMPMTLISIPGIIRKFKKTAVIFCKDECSIERKGKTIMKARMHPDRRLYILNATILTDNANAASTGGVPHMDSAFAMNDSESATLWHQRIGHAPVAVLKKCASLGLGVPSNLKNLPESCDDCLRYKVTRVTVPTTHTRSFNPGECWVSDTKGPVRVASASGYKFYRIYVCAATGFMIIKFVKSTDCATQWQHFRQICAWSERQTSNAVKIFRTDNGSEYVSKDFDAWLADQGITHERSTPSNQWQNGIAERAHRTVNEMALAMLSHSQLPRHWWAEAANTAVYTLNNIVHRANDQKTPYELFTGHRSSLAKMRVFGCKAWNLMQKPESRDKQQPKGRPCIFLGYSATSKAYRLYNLSKKSVEEGVHVRFFEKEFLSDPEHHGGDQDEDSDDDDEDPSAQAKEDEETEGPSNDKLAPSQRFATPRTRPALERQLATAPPAPQRASSRVSRPPSRYFPKQTPH